MYIMYKSMKAPHTFFKKNQKSTFDFLRSIKRKKVNPQTSRKTVTRKKRDTLRF